MKNRTSFRFTFRNDFPFRSRRGAVALVGVMFLGMVLLILAAALIGFSVYQTRDRARYELYKDEFCAAEEAMNRVFGHVQFLVKNSDSTYANLIKLVTATECAPASTMSVYNNLTGTTAKYDISDFSLTGPTTDRTYTVRLRATKQQTNAHVKTPGVVLTQDIKIIYTPLCNFAIFYDPDLEIAPGAPMSVVGPVHCNGNMYLGGGGSTLSFNGKVTATGNIYGGRYSGSGQSTSGDGTKVDIRGANGSMHDMYRNDTTSKGWLDSLDSVWQSLATSWWGGNVQDSSLGATSQDIEGLSDGTDNHVIIEANATGTAALVKKAGLIITSSITAVSGTGATGTVSAVDSAGATVYLNYYTLDNTVYATNRSTGTVSMKNAAGKTVSVTVNSVASTSAFYNAREGKTVASVNLDVGKLATASTATKTDTYNSSAGTSTYASVSGQYSVLPSNGVVYINNGTTVNTAELGVRLTNAATLPVPTNATGLSFVSDDPVYVKGDYNTTNKTLSMVAGDAITLLSGDWQDQAASGYSKRTAAETTYNAVFISGIVASANGKYSGGVENYFRLLENWGGKKLTFTGSILELFKSKTATSPWTANSGYYDAATRVWSWDSALGTTNPPGIPNVVTMARTGWKVSQ